MCISLLGFPGISKADQYRQGLYFHKETMLDCVGMSFVLLLSAVGAATVER